MSTTVAQQHTAVHPTWTSLKRLIVVCGHAVYLGGPNLDPAEVPLDRHWHLQPFQRGEGADYVAHVRAGVELAAADSGALLVLSGGQTREPHLLSEGQSYFDVALAHGFWEYERQQQLQRQQQETEAEKDGAPVENGDDINSRVGGGCLVYKSSQNNGYNIGDNDRGNNNNNSEDDVRRRTTTEEFSRDSFDNVLFGIARFVECVGAGTRLPEAVTIVSWGFKRERFHFHADTLNWPRAAFRFVGVGEPEALEAVRKSERANLALFGADPTGYGAAGGPLGAKKRARNPYGRQHGYATSCPGLRGVLEWTEAAKVPVHLTPWARLDKDTR